MSELMTLREICIRGGVTRRMVQGYEQKGLVSPVSTNKYGHLLYDEEGLSKIKQVRLYQRFGFKLDEIKEINEMTDGELILRLEKQLKVLKSKRDEYDELINIANKIIKNVG